MPDILYKGERFYCKPGENLRKVLVKHNLSPYNGLSKFINCHGIGSCGTCAVMIKGVVNRKTWMEKWRLRFPPHKAKNGLRLACQVRVWSDLEITKGQGFWGQRARQEDPKINQSQNQSRTID
jgi:ferredoxin